MSINCWSGDEYRVYNVSRTIDEWITNDFDIAVNQGWIVNHYCGYILEDVRGKYSLNYKVVREMVNGLDYSQIVNITISVEIQIGNHIRRVVKKNFKLPNSCRLRECCCYGLKIKT